MHSDETQIDIIKLLAEGATSAEIGTFLNVNVRAIEYQIGKLKDAYGACNTTHLVAIFFRLNKIK